MDSQIYMLLAAADQEKSIEHVRQAFKILDPDVSKEMRSGSGSGDGVDQNSTNDVENFSQSLYVECAEKAINVIKFIFFIYYDFIIN